MSPNSFNIFVIFPETSWSCPLCTFMNKASLQQCATCGSNRSEPDATHDSRQTLQRQTSMSVESRRRHDESQAREQWKATVQFCKEVSFCRQQRQSLTASGDS